MNFRRREQKGAIADGVDGRAGGCARKKNTPAADLDQREETGL